jgi:hypothetical protein
MSAPQSSLDFWQLPLSKAVRRKLAAIDESRKRHPSQKMALVGMLLNHACDRTNGTYVALSPHPATHVATPIVWLCHHVEVRGQSGIVDLKDFDLYPKEGIAIHSVCV